MLRGIERPNPSEEFRLFLPAQEPSSIQPRRRLGVPPPARITRLQRASPPFTGHSVVAKPAGSVRKPRQVRQAHGLNDQRTRTYTTGQQGLTQREIAAAGVSYAYISRSEAGQRRPSVRARCPARPPKLARRRTAFTTLRILIAAPSRVRAPMKSYDQT